MYQKPLVQEHPSLFYSFLSQKKLEKISTLKYNIIREKLNCINNNFFLKNK